jgi:peroxiredoxin
MLSVLGLIFGIVIGSRDGTGAAAKIEPPVVTYVAYTPINNPAPSFTLPSLNGEAVSLSDYRGKWVFLNFWATWCPPCVAEMPELQKLHEGSFGNDPAQVAVLAVNNGEDRATAQAFMNEHKLSLPVVLDTDKAVSGQYVVMQMPITFMIDPDGVVRYQHIGALSSEVIALYLERIRNHDNGTLTPRE